MYTGPPFVSIPLVAGRLGIPVEKTATMAEGSQAMDIYRSGRRQLDRRGGQKLSPMESASDAASFLAAERVPGSQAKANDRACRELDAVPVDAAYSAFLSVQDAD